MAFLLLGVLILLGTSEIKFSTEQYLLFFGLSLAIVALISYKEKLADYESATLENDKLDKELFRLHEKYQEIDTENTEYASENRQLLIQITELENQLK